MAGMLSGSNWCRIGIDKGHWYSLSGDMGPDHSITWMMVATCSMSVCNGSQVYISAVTHFQGPIIPIIIYHLPWYLLLVSRAPLWSVVGNKCQWRTLDGWKSILRLIGGCSEGHWCLLEASESHHWFPSSSNGYRWNRLMFPAPDILLNGGQI